MAIRINKNPMFINYFKSHFEFKTIFFIFILFFTSKLSATDTVIGPGTTTRATTLHLDGTAPDTLTVQAGGTLTSNPGVVPTVSMDGRTTTTNNGIITTGALTDAAIYNTTAFNNTFSTIINSGTITSNDALGIRVVPGPPGNFAPFRITNSGVIDGIALANNLLDPINNPYIINNETSGIIAGTFEVPITLGSGGSPTNSFNVTINNSGVIQENFSNSIESGVLVEGPLTATINNNNTGLILGDVSNLGRNNVIYIFNASAGSRLNADYIGVAGNSNQYNANGGTGTVTLGGNIIDIAFINANSGTFANNGFNITGFNTFTIQNDATFLQSAGNITGTNFTNSGTHRIQTAGGITTRTITSNYTQTPSGTFSPDIVSTTSYSRLAVVGSTNIQGGTIAVNLPNGLTFLRNGDIFDIITSTGPLTYNLNTLITPFVFSLVPEALALNIVRLRFNSFRFLNTIPALDSIAAAIDQIAINPPTPGLQGLINALLALPNLAAFESALAQLSPNVHQAIIIPGMNIQQVILDKIASRLDAMRLASGFGSREYSGYMAGDLAGSCTSMGPIFYNNILTQQPVDSYPGYIANSYGIGFAGDMPIFPHFKLGAGIGVSYTIVQPNGIMADFGNNIKVTTIQPLIYGSLDYSPYFLDALFSWGYNSYNSQRNIIFLQQRATSNFNGVQFSMEMRTGLVIPTCWFDLTIPLISYQYAKLKQGPHSEKGGGVANLSIQGQKTTASLFNLGAKIAVVNQPQGFYYEIHGGALLATQANRNVFVTASFVQGGPTWTLQSANPSREGLNIGTSLSLLFRENILFTAGFDYVSWDSLKVYSPWARLRWLF